MYVYVVGTYQRSMKLLSIRASFVVVLIAVIAGVHGREHRYRPNGSVSVPERMSTTPGITVTRYVRVAPSELVVCVSFDVRCIARRRPASFDIRCMDENVVL